MFEDLDSLYAAVAIIKTRYREIDAVLNNAEFGVDISAHKELEMLNAMHTLVDAAAHLTHTGGAEVEYEFVFGN
jgi:short-subunit dehydrogenase